MRESIEVYKLEKNRGNEFVEYLGNILQIDGLLSYSPKWLLNTDQRTIFGIS